MPKTPTYADRNAAMKHLSLTMKYSQYDFLLARADALGITVAGLIKGILGEYQLAKIEKDKGGVK